MGESKIAVEMLARRYNHKNGVLPALRIDWFISK